MPGTASTTCSAPTPSSTNAIPSAPLRGAGLVVAGLGCALGFAAAWALPVWMTLLGVGFAMVAVAARPGPRRALGLRAAGQLASIMVLIVAIEVEVGTPDEYGDYPAAGGIALMFLAVMAIVALVQLSRMDDVATTSWPNSPTPA